MTLWGYNKPNLEGGKIYHENKLVSSIKRDIKQALKCVNLKRTYKTHEENAMFGIWILIKQTNHQKDILRKSTGFEHEWDIAWF